MKQGAGKSKGGDFERQCCRRLSLWLSKGARSDLLWRSAMSGGRATVGLRKGLEHHHQAGDISAIGELAYEFCQQTYIECKTYNDLQIDRGMICGTGNLRAFWTETEKQASRYGKRPLLIAHQSRMPTLVVTQINAPVFDNGPLLVVHPWKALVHLFDEVTRVEQPMQRRK